MSTGWSVSMADTFIGANAWLIPLLPLALFVINGLWLGRKNWKLAAGLATLVMGIDAVLGIMLGVTYYDKVLSAHPGSVEQAKLVLDLNWMSINEHLMVKMGILLDPMSVMMTVVVTVIAALVHFYSIGYMKEDPSAGRFFALLPLFCFSMLGLVLATNLIQMFVFWELVGVSSYQLIGFWYHKPSAVAASKKAFIITRFADAFFLLGILVVSFGAGGFDFSQVNSDQAASALAGQSLEWGGMNINLLTLGTLLIFTGGWGKSAMFPLHVWLPDAMEGPTPVSSIIHSATMVVAGVYLTAKMFPLFAASDVTLHVIAAIGAFTALFAAIIACTQVDIKRILAFSTLSQLGYMMFSLGVAKVSGGEATDLNILGFQASAFHIFTHAFFKCMLFLMAGSVIHVVHSNDIWEMGGLRKEMPWTYLSTLIGCLAIGGIWPLSGFWSKDEIILAAFQSGHTLIGVTGLVVGALTAFYMFRLFFVVFHGKAKKERHHVHEDKMMTLPIVFLAIPSAGIGFLSHHLFAESMLPVMKLESSAFGHLDWLPYVASGSGAAGILIAWLLFGNGSPAREKSIRESLGGVYTLVQNKFYFDELYLFITHKIIFDKIASPVKWFDRHIVDGSMNGVGKICQLGSFVVRLLQSGKVQWYAAVTIFGIYLMYVLAKFPI